MSVFYGPMQFSGGYIFNYLIVFEQSFFIIYFALS